MVDYDYYTNDYGSFVIPEEYFKNYELKAAAYVNAVTFDRIDENDLTDDIKNAVCDTAECYYRAGQSKAALEGISSEKVGDYSVSYSDNGSQTVNALQKALRLAVKYWLGNTGLLYKGADE